MSNENSTVRYLSLGCGVQSSTIAEMIVEDQLPRVDFAIFADTGDEPQWVYTQRDYLKTRLQTVDIPLVTVQKESITDAIFRARGRFASIPAYTREKTDSPVLLSFWQKLSRWLRLDFSRPYQLKREIGMMRRQCTSEYKIVPIEKHLSQYMLKLGKAKRTRARSIRIHKGQAAVCVQGISLDEVTRMKTNKRGWIKNEYPLVNLRMTRLDCANWLQSRNLPVPEKSSCRICPYHSKVYWRRMKEQYPADWRHVVKVDNYLRTDNNFTAGMRGDMFLYREAIPLEDVDFTTGDAQNDFFELCDGYCFV